MSRQFNTDCEGPISKNDNAQELSAHFLPDGGSFFARISAYDDYLADVIHRPGYKAGDTLRLILPFLRAYGADNDSVEQYSAGHILLVPGARESLVHIRTRMPSFIISTSYSPYIRALCEGIGFPAENAYSTDLDLDQYALPDREVARLRAVAEEVLALPVIELPSNVTSAEDLSMDARAAIRRLDGIFWEEIPGMVSGRMLSDVNPIGGYEKARAIQDSLRRTGNEVEDVLYVGDSITDVQAFDLVREGGGLAVSFNGNRYALRSAEVACIVGHTLVLSILADAFVSGGRAGVLELANTWPRRTTGGGHATLQRANNVDPVLTESLFGRYPDELPTVKIVTDANRDELIAESERVRQRVRGEEVGRLG